MYFAYRITNSYGIAILIFTILVSVVLYPVNVLAHKNSIRLLQLQPALNGIKKLHGGDKGRLNEEQYNLFKSERYSPFVGLIPLLAQLFLIIGMLQVMYHPLQHIMRLRPEVIQQVIETARYITGVSGGFGEQLRALEVLQDPTHASLFAPIFYGYIPPSIMAFDFNFLGLNLSVIPSFGAPLSVLAIPAISGVTALIFCFAQSGISPGALSQSSKTNMGLTIFTVVFSIYFAFVTPLGVGMYWILRNIFGTAVIFILDKGYNPKKLAPEAMAYLESTKKTPQEMAEERKEKKVHAAREKQDIARFKQAKKTLVFYALSGGQYKYYKTIIDYILQHSELTIHYLTNDPEDAIFNMEHARLIHYYASQRKTTMLLLKLDAKMLVTTVPDLQVYHMKRSIVRDDIEYVYVQHGLGSTHFAAREEAHDHFDTIFCVGEHQAVELRRHEEMKGLPEKNLVRAGYGLYDQLVESYSGLDMPKDNVPKILIAPSWQQDNIMDSCIEPLLEGLLGNGHRVIIRPHPQYIRMFSERLDNLRNKYSEQVTSKELIFDTDFLSNETILSADIVITDWSNIAFEFSFCTLKPSIFINTPAKILNPSYEQYGIVALEILLRDRIGQSVDPQKAKEVNEIVTHMLEEKDAYTQQIQEVVKEYLYYPGRSGEAGGKYIIRRLKDEEND